MNREEVDRFLAEADDVISDWEGSNDSAEWRADGSHQPSDVFGHYMDNETSMRRTYGLHFPVPQAQGHESQVAVDGAMWGRYQPPRNRPIDMEAYRAETRYRYEVQTFANGDQLTVLFVSSP